MFYKTKGIAYLKNCTLSKLPALKFSLKKSLLSAQNKRSFDEGYIIYILKKKQCQSISSHFYKISYSSFIVIVIIFSRVVELIDHILEVTAL